MTNLFYLIVGGIAGTVSRYYFSAFVYHKCGNGFPYGTFLINLTGCLLAGFFSVMVGHEKWLGGLQARVLLISGFCGSYTTFSAYMIETAGLVSEGQIIKSLAYVLLSIVLGLVFLRLGMLIGENI